MGMNSGQGIIAILGAGCAGLAAGIHLTKLGARVVIIEKDDHVGGLAGGVRLKGNIYEYGPHAFHTTDPIILNDIKSLMGDELIAYRRTIKIKFLGNYFQFPLAVRDVIFKLPLTTVIHAGISFLWHFVTGFFWKPKVETSETILRRYYGTVLYELFFKTYITAVWGIPPSEFSPSFARQRIPRLNLLDIFDQVWSKIKNRFQRDLKTDDFVEKVEGNLYTTQEGFSRITQRMADAVMERGGKIEVNATVTKIVRQGDSVKAVEYVQDDKSQVLECRAIINTLPINEAIQMLEPPLDAGIIQSARALKFRALVFVGLLVRRETVLPSSFMYFRQHSFNRISDLAQFGFHVKPEGHTLLVAEISCGVEDRAWTDDAFAKQAVLDDLIAEKLLTQDQVVEAHVFRAQHAYPIYALDYEKHLAKSLEAISAMKNIETAGRQGRFAYINTHIAMKMGYEAADRLMAKLGHAKPA